LKNERRALEQALKNLESRLRGKPLSLALKFERARLLDRLGKSDAARTAYVEILQRDDAHFGALNNLGMLLYRAGSRNEALTCFNAAVAKHPRNPMARANLGMLLLRGGAAQEAREQYEAALAIDPANAEAHKGLALALSALGETAQAGEHARAGFARQPIAQLAYRGSGPPVRVLLLVSATGGNVPTDRFLDDTVFATHKLVAEYAGADLTLPAHDLIFNAIGDADRCAAVLQSIRPLIERSGAPVINPPEAVAQTGRVDNARRLAGVPGLLAPKAAAFGRTELELNPAAAFEREGLRLPLLLRAPGFHTGEHVERIDDLLQIGRALQNVPGSAVLAIELAELRASDGAYRKYRVMFVGGQCYPLHLAISDRWMVHYFSAEMERHAQRRREEEAFLTSMEAVLGPFAIEALRTVADHLALDYAGADFALDAQGRVVLFEANATMIVPTPDASVQWDYRRAAIDRIESAVRAMLVTRSRRAR
jgi:hypothetical protein